MKNTGQQQPKRSSHAHHSQLPIVRITIDDAVLVLGVLELVQNDLEPDTDLAFLVNRSAARISARLAGLAEALGPTVTPIASEPAGDPASVSPTVERDRRTTASGPPRNERRTPA